MLALMSHPKQYALLKAKPERIPIAVEEMLRYDSPLQIDFYTLKSRAGHLPAGTHVGLGIAAANRDPAVFHNADVFDITRKRNHHLTIGVGAERITMQVVLKLLLQKNIGLDIDMDDLKYAPTMRYRHLISLPVRVF
jgi:cytochrome P450